MKSILTLSILFSFSIEASSTLELQKKHIEAIIAKNQQDINETVLLLRQDQAELRLSTNSNPVLQSIQNNCADTDFERLIEGVKRSWEFDFVKMTTSRLESSYRGYKNNPQLEPNLKISSSEVFNLSQKLTSAREIKICNYEELFIFDETGDFIYAREGAWQNYDPTLSFADIKSQRYQKTLNHIVAKGPVKVVGEVSRFGSPSSSYRFGKVNRLITYDKVFSGGYSFFHAEETNPLDIIKKAKRF